VWNFLLERSSSNNIHLTFEWLFTWWKYFNQDVDKNLLLLVAYKNTKAVGIAPLMIKTRKVKGLIPLREITFLGDELSDFSDFIIGEDRREVVDEFVSYFLKTKHLWDELKLKNIPQDSPNLRILVEALKKRGFKVSKFEHTKCFYIDIENQSWESYYKTTSKKFVQRDLNRLKNKIERLGGWKFYRNTGVNVEKLAQVIRNLHIKRQKQLGRKSLFENSKELAFILDVMHLFKDQDFLDYAILKVQGKIVSYTLGFKYNNILYWWNTGFDPAFSEISPTKVLLYLLLKSCFEEGLAEFNFMRGETEYKQKWTKTFRWNYKIHALNSKTLYSRVINRFRESYRLGEESA
jgi:CelD/BcsL family acetyltransferase involved in cellulose biosynthesis